MTCSEKPILFFIFFALARLGWAPQASLWLRLCLGLWAYLSFDDASHGCGCRQIMSILTTFCTDERCDVHQCLLAVRETKHGWFDLFCPGSVACIDNGQLYSEMVCIGCES